MKPRTSEAARKLLRELRAASSRRAGETVPDGLGTPGAVESAAWGLLVSLAPDRRGPKLDATREKLASAFPLLVEKILFGDRTGLGLGETLNGVRIWPLPDWAEREAVVIRAQNDRAAAEKLAARYLDVERVRLGLPGQKWLTRACQGLPDVEVKLLSPRQKQARRKLSGRNRSELHRVRRGGK